MEHTASRASRRLLLALCHWSLLVAILALSAYLRFTNLDWDEGKAIHPDEVHMQQTLAAIHTPESLSVYFDTNQSPLNVVNTGRQYSYGTLPLFLTRFTVESLDRGCGESPGRLNRDMAALLLLQPGDCQIAPGALTDFPRRLGQAIASLRTYIAEFQCSPGTFTDVHSKKVGRALSALADLGTTLLIYLLGRRLYGEGVGLLAAGLGTLTAFSIQQAHFLTVDSMACFFTVLTACFAVRGAESGNWADFGLAGLATGLATACKVSAAAAALLPFLAAVVWVWGSPSPGPFLRGRGQRLWRAILLLVLAGILALVAFRITQPYAFQGPSVFGVRLYQPWLDRLGQIQVEQAGRVDFPSGRQWANRAPILFPLKDMVFWGMGLPLGLAAWAGWALVGFELWRGKRVHLVLWVWSSVTFLYSATRWVKTMRSFLPLYPLLAILGAYLLIRLCCASRRWLRQVGYGAAALVVVGAALWSTAVFSIYLREHTRLAASRWIYANVPLGSVIANEHWDWGPPLPVDGRDPAYMYRGFEMALYGEDTPEKYAQLLDWLDKADYVVTGSNRLYASIPRLAARYPLTIAYYRALFAGDLGFELVADFSSYPAIGPCQFPDDETPFALADSASAYHYQTQPIRVVLPPADEAFSVYDHPRVLVFRKTAGYSHQRATLALGGVDLAHVARGLTPVEASPVLMRLDVWALARPLVQRIGLRLAAVLAGLLLLLLALSGVAVWRYLRRRAAASRQECAGRKD